LIFASASLVLSMENNALTADFALSARSPRTTNGSSSSGGITVFAPEKLFPTSADTTLSSCHDHGYLWEGQKTCECMDCYSGPYCTSFVGDNGCSLSVVGGTPMVFVEYWVTQPQTEIRMLMSRQVISAATFDHHLTSVDHSLPRTTHSSTPYTDHSCAARCTAFASLVRLRPRRRRLVSGGVRPGGNDRAPGASGAPLPPLRPRHSAPATPPNKHPAPHTHFAPAPPPPPTGIHPPHSTAESTHRAADPKPAPPPAPVRPGARPARAGRQRRHARPVRFRPTTSPPPPPTPPPPWPLRPRVRIGLVLPNHPGLGRGPRLAAGSANGLTTDPRLGH
jgi:hypothetical protein